jgi:hypothetical protein
VVFVALPPADKLVDKAMLQWTSPLPKIDKTRTQDESSVCSNHRHHFPSSLRYSITARTVRARGTRRRRRICSRATRFGFSRPRVPAVLAAGPGAETGTPEDDARECRSYVFFSFLFGCFPYVLGCLLQDLGLVDVSLVGPIEERRPNS